MGAKQVTTTVKSYEDFFVEAMEQYAAGEYSTVYDMMTAEEEQYPEHAGEILYMRSCMAARMGNDARALDLIRAALDRGIWYGETMLRQTPSWKDLQGRP